MDLVKTDLHILRQCFWVNTNLNLLSQCYVRFVFAFNTPSVILSPVTSIHWIHFANGIDSYYGLQNEKSTSACLLADDICYLFVIFNGYRTEIVFAHISNMPPRPFSQSQFLEHAVVFLWIFNYVTFNWPLFRFSFTGQNRWSLKS
jgi:hypothetical protein